MALQFISIHVGHLLFTTSHSSCICVFGVPNIFFIGCRSVYPRCKLYFVFAFFKCLMIRNESSVCKYLILSQITKS